MVSHFFGSGLRNHERCNRGGRAPDVQNARTPGAFHLAGTGLARHLGMGVEHHAHAGGTHRVAQTDQAA